MFHFKRRIFIMMVAFLFLSSGFIYADSNRTVLNSYADVNKTVFGQEYLSAFHKKLMALQSVKIVFSGDSTTSGTGVDAGYDVASLMKYDFNRDGMGSQITAVNRGQSGKDTQHWVTDYVAGDIAENPDLLVLRWGINDPGWDKNQNPAMAGTAGDATRRTVDDFKTSLRTGLEKIRAVKNLATTSIVLMSPNSTSDSPNRRDALWYEQINDVIRQAARDYQCTYIDTYALYRDSNNATGWMDDPYGDGRHIHPANVMNLWITGTLYDVIMPTSIRTFVGGGLHNMHDTYKIKSAGDAPSTYQRGVSLYRAMTGFPYDGIVTTFYQSDEVLMQINSGYDTSKSEFAFRLGFKVTNTWSTWTKLAKMPNQSNSTATDVTQLKNDFNALLAKMRASGLME